MTTADLPIVLHWRSQPHVRRWWGEPDVEPPNALLAEPRVALWIAEIEARPFALIQDYVVADWPPHHFDMLPNPSRGIDMFIGELDLIGRGHGPRLLRQYVDDLFASGVRAVGIDPHPENTAAQKAFAKAGFQVIGGPVETRWNTAMLMARLAGES